MEYVVIDLQCCIHSSGLTSRSHHFLSLEQHWSDDYLAYVVLPPKVSPHFFVVLLKTRPLLVTRLTSAMLTTDGNGISLPFSMNVALYLYGIALLDSYGTGPGK